MEPALLPAWLIKRLPGSPTISWNVNILASCWLITLALLSSISGRLAGIPHVCLFQATLGIPCPGCGISRSLLAAAHFHLSSAWSFNPAGMLIWIFLLFEICARTLILWKESFAIGFQKMFTGLGSILIVSLWFVWIWRLVLTLRS